MPLSAGQVTLAPSQVSASSQGAAVGRQTRRVEVRVMIHWGDRWYVTHLRPFH